MQKKKLISRRKAIGAGLTAVGGLMLGGCYKKPLPPTYGNLLRMGDLLTYVSERTLLPGQKPVRQFSKTEITSFPAVGCINPADPAIRETYSKDYEALKNSNFNDWQLSVEGLVSRPAKYTMADLKKLGEQTQITRHQCEEGWSAIAEWTGVTLSAILQHAGIMPNARFVSIYGYDNYAESIDMVDALHPQTLLAYTMNGADLPLQHGAPVRLRIETQIGYKSVKYVHTLKVTDTFIDPNHDQEAGWSWSTGI
ncbi:MAG TPA: molybdopterin-dependent oxidoreductase [Mucilaginibacter sp.]|nr:molybdopterin-dependent oxidoreductase [Mucilaginibacter sp.]